MWSSSWWSWARRDVRWPISPIGSFPIPCARPAARRQLVYSEALPARGGGPVYVTLDSAAPYRVEPADGSVRISPRLAHRPYPREVGSLYADGLFIQPRIVGEHRVDA